jgi:hypothetical protein
MEADGVGWRAAPFHTEHVSFGHGNLREEAVGEHERLLNNT